MFDLFAAFIALTTLITYVNYRYLRLPPTIGIMATALLLSLAAHLLALAGYSVIEDEMQALTRQIDFSQVLMSWFLPALLFAGALHVNLKDLASHKWSIGFLATGGVLVSTFAVGTLAYYLFPLFGWQINFVYCLLFGALISPTDPIAVMSLLKTSGAPKSLQMTIVGESLFNDGTAVVLFAMLLGVLALGHAPTASDVALLFLKEAVGGIAFGLIIGYAAFYMLRTVDQYQLTVMLTLALVFGVAALSQHLHVSAPLAVVAAGLVIGNQGRSFAMSESTRRYVDGTWEIIDEILNALLFALIGLELLVLPFDWLHVVVALLLSIVVLGARFTSIAPIVAIARRAHDARHAVPRGSTALLVWGGLRGGISVALALSLPFGPERDLLLTLTYVVVLISILLQGLSVAPLVRKLFGHHEAHESAPSSLPAPLPPQVDLPDTRTPGRSHGAPYIDGNVLHGRE